METVGVPSFFYLKDFLLRALARIDYNGAFLYGERGYAEAGNYRFNILATASGIL